MINKKTNFNNEINNLFEKFIKNKEKGLKNIEDLKSRITNKIDTEIKRLYEKKDFITEIILKKDELKKQKLSVWKKFIRTSFLNNLRYLFSMPFIYMMIIPAIIMHIFVEIYHQVCFRLYKIPRVKPSSHFMLDRSLLPYLNWFERFNCMYCSYFNCLISYVREIAGRTERYWCPIKHSKSLKDQHSEYDKFVDYSDGEKLRKKWKELRKFDY